MKPNELLENCKGNTATCGIYMILCVPNGKAYIGQSIDIQSRWLNHEVDLYKKAHHNKELQKLYEKYGKYAFHYSILENCVKDKLDEQEQHHIKLLDRDLCLNMEVISVTVNKTEIQSRRESLVELLESFDIDYVDKNTYFEVRQKGGAWLMYYLDSGRWRQKDKEKLYFSKSAVQFIRKYVLDGNSKKNKFMGKRKTRT